MITTTVGVKLDKETRARLKNLAKAEERYEQEKLEDEVRWQRYLETGTHITHDELTAWLDELADGALLSRFV